MKVRIKNLVNYYQIDQRVDDVVEARDWKNLGYECLCSYSDKKDWLFFRYDQVELIEEDQLTDQHYNNENGSLYKFAQDHELNAWEFDILKRIVRCRKKGQFTEDLEKTKRVIDLYLKEFEA
jgi:hypothetical protein